MAGNDGTGLVVSGDPQISFANDVITINVDQTSLDSKSYYLKATTNGGVSAYKEIQVKRVEDPCIFVVKKTKMT